MAEPPNKYNKAYTGDLPAMFANGENVAEVAQTLGISRQTFFEWVDKYPAFADAYEQGKTASEAWWCKLGRAGATGKVAIQPTIWLFNMRTRFGWDDKAGNDSEAKKANAAEKVTAEFSRKGLKLAGSR